MSSPSRAAYSRDMGAEPSRVGEPTPLEIPRQGCAARPSRRYRSALTLRRITLRNVVVAFIDEDHRRLIGKDNAVSIIQEVRKVRAAESAAQHPVFRKIRCDVFPHGYRRAPGEQHRARRRGIRAIRLLIRADGFFPTFGTLILSAQRNRQETKKNYRICPKCIQ